MNILNLIMEFIKKKKSIILYWILFLIFLIYLEIYVDIKLYN